MKVPRKFKYKPGDIVKVTVNGQEYDSIIDKEFTQRFVSNALIYHLINTYKISLNSLFEDACSGKFSYKEYYEFYIAMGYTLLGFEEVFGRYSLFPDKMKVTIENPVEDELDRLSEQRRNLKTKIKI